MSEELRERIYDARSMGDLKELLVEVYRRLQALEACQAERERIQPSSSCEKPFQAWEDLTGHLMVVFVPGARQVHGAMCQDVAERLCCVLNECWAFSRAGD